MGKRELLKYRHYTNNPIYKINQERIAVAENAVMLRARELFRATDDNGEETEALG